MNGNATRREVLASLGAVGTVGLAGCASDPPESDGGATTSSTRTTGGSRPAAVGLETLAAGFRAPVDVAFAPDADRRYVADQSGVVRVHEPEGLAEEPFLDLRETVVTGGERGLLGLALHPDFEQDRRVFVRYSAPVRAGTPDGYSHTFVLAEFTASDDGRRVRPDSERTLLEVPEPQSNHNAGSLAFGPEGYLYVGVGDGGAGGDRGTGHVGDWYDAVAGGNGQDVTENLLGSLLRIDVDAEGTDRPYGIPEDNPLVGREGLDEHYAWGFRNPWRFSFDGEDLYVGDVGQNRYEEVDLVRRGGNYGWNVREGTHCFDAAGCPSETPADVRGGEPLLDPIIEYPHRGAPVSGNSIIGGVVYRGASIPNLEGTYVFGDLSVDGRLFAATRPDADSGGGSDANSEGLWPTRTLALSGDAGSKLTRLLSFGRDADGEVYILGVGDDGGGLHRLVPAEG
jgi:glucose/arabinose dehydrogenase